MRWNGSNRKAEGNAIAATTGRKKRMAHTTPTARAPRSVAESAECDSGRSILGSASLVRYSTHVESDAEHASRRTAPTDARRRERERLTWLRRDPLGPSAGPRSDVRR